MGLLRESTRAERAAFRAFCDAALEAVLIGPTVEAARFNIVAALATLSHLHWLAYGNSAPSPVADDGQPAMLAREVELFAVANELCGNKPGESAPARATARGPLCQACGENPGDVIVTGGRLLCEACASGVEVRGEVCGETPPGYGNPAKVWFLDRIKPPTPGGIRSFVVTAQTEWLARHYAATAGRWIRWNEDDFARCLELPAVIGSGPGGTVISKIIEPMPPGPVGNPEPRIVGKASLSCCPGCIAITGIKSSDEEICADCGARWERGDDGWYISPGDRDEDGQPLDRREPKG